ncbi:MAG: hypothetical protein O6947_03945, partial [Acidobacteria bacterium]|nr:hypothetical protein [Acidobacteriota bacterium]
FATAGDVWGWGKIDIAAAIDDLLNLITDLTTDPASEAFTATGPADATTFNVYRGSLSALDGSFYGTCFLSGLPTPDFLDTTPDPAPGQGFFYLMTGLDGTIEGNLGLTDTGALRPNLNPCP